MLIYPALIHACKTCMDILAHQKGGISLNTYLEVRRHQAQVHDLVLLDERTHGVRILDVLSGCHHKPAAKAERHPDVKHAAIKDERHGLETHGAGTH